MSETTIEKISDGASDKRGADAVVKTAGRVFEVLELFREVRAPLSVRDIAERCNYPVSSTSVLLKSLATMGYLTYDRDLRAFFPTLRIATLGDWLYDALYGSGDVLRLLEDICRDTGETALLAVQNDIYAQYVHVQPNRQQVIQLNVPMGTRRLLCWSGTGWAMLSQFSDEAIERLVERTLTRLRNDPLAESITLANVMERVEAARRDGYALSSQTVTSGAGVVAIPLPVTANGMRMAVAAGGVAERMVARKDAIAKIMAAHVQRYTATLRD